MSVVRYTPAFVVYGSLKPLYFWQILKQDPTCIYVLYSIVHVAEIIHTISHDIEREKVHAVCSTVYP